MDAFKIIYKGTAFDVVENSRLTVEFVSAVFNEDKILTGSFSYPVTFSPTVKNHQLFRQSYLLENRLNRQPLEVDVELFGMSWKKAKLTYDVSRDGYEGQLLIDIGTVADWMRDRPLNSVFTVSNNGLFVSHKGMSIGTSLSDVRANIRDSCMNVGKYPWVFFPIVNENVFGGREEAHLQTSVVNQFGYNSSADFIIESNGFYTPFFYTTWVIKEVCRFLGYEAKGSFLDDAFVTSLTIYNNGIVRSSLLQDRMIYPAQHLPSISVSNFFKALRNDLKCAIHFDSLTRTAHFELAKEMLTSKGTDKVVDLTQGIEQGSIKIHHNDVGGYMLKAKIDEGDNLYTVRPYVKSFIIGDTDKAKSVDMAIGTLFMRENSSYAGINGLRLPHAQQICNVYDPDYSYVDGVYNPEKTYNKNEFDLRMISYKGTISKSRSGLLVRVPYATSDSKDINGSDVYPVTTDPGGEKGFLNKMCLDWYAYLLNTEKVELKALVDILSFSRINPLRPILLPGDMKGTISCLMDKIVFEPKPEGSLINARLTVYPHYNNDGVQTRRVEFVEDEIVKPEEKIYVVVEKANLRRVTNKSKEKRDRADMKLWFYKDPFNSIPASVTNLTVYVKRMRTDGFSHVYSFTVTAEGSTVVLWDDTVYFYYKEGLFGLWAKTEYWAHYYLEASPTDSYVPNGNRN